MVDVCEVPCYEIEFVRGSEEGVDRSVLGEGVWIGRYGRDNVA